MTEKKDILFLYKISFMDQIQRPYLHGGFYIAVF